MTTKRTRIYLANDGNNDVWIDLEHIVSATEYGDGDKARVIIDLVNGVSFTFGAGADDLIDDWRAYHGDIDE